MISVKHSSTLCVIGIKGGNAERQEFSRRGKFRAQISVLPVTNLFHGFAKCGIGMELAKLEHRNSEKIPQKLEDGAKSHNLELKQGLRPPIVR